MKKYGHYQTVDEQWCNELPDHWRFLRLKRIFQERKERNNPIKTDSILSLTAKQGVIPYTEKIGAGGNKPKDDLSKYNIAKSGDLLINCMNVVSGAAGVSRWDGAISPVYYALYPRNEDVNVWYYHYLFRLLPFQRSLLGLGKGILMHESDEGVLTTVRMRISMDYLGNVMLPLPSRDEQDQIVHYLNWQTKIFSQVNRIKQGQIKLLKEQRKAVIDEGILHGFRSDNYKVSDVFGLDKVPSTWEVLPLKRICKVNASITSVINKLADTELVTFLPMENVSTTGDIDCSIKRPLSTVRIGYSSFAKNDVVVAKITPCFENGKGACLENLDTEIGFGTTEFINLRPSNRVLPRYLYMITMTQPFRKFGEEIMTGSAGQKRISADYIKNFVIGIPDIKEQEQILSEIEQKLKKIDTLIKIEEENINILHELRTRTVLNVISGQIDVRNRIIPVPNISSDERDDDFDGIIDVNEDDTDANMEV